VHLCCCGLHEGCPTAPHPHPHLQERMLLKDGPSNWRKAYFMPGTWVLGHGDCSMLLVGLLAPVCLHAATWALLQRASFQNPGPHHPQSMPPLLPASPRGGHLKNLAAAIPVGRRADTGVSMWRRWLETHGAAFPLLPRCLGNLPPLMSREQALDRWVPRQWTAVQPILRPCCSWW
jgi:hypothetical protein